MAKRVHEFTGDVSSRSLKKRSRLENYSSSSEDEDQSDEHDGNGGVPKDDLQPIQPIKERENLSDDDGLDSEEEMLMQMFKEQRNEAKKIKRGNYDGMSEEDKIVELFDETNNTTSGEINNFSEDATSDGEEDEDVSETEFVGGSASYSLKYDSKTIESARRSHDRQETEKSATISSDKDIKNAIRILSSKLNDHETPEKCMQRLYLVVKKEKKKLKKQWSAVSSIAQQDIDEITDAVAMLDKSTVAQGVALQKPKEFYLGLL